MIFYSSFGWNTWLETVFGDCPSNISRVQAVAGDAKAHRDWYRPM